MTLLRSLLSDRHRLPVAGVTLALLLGMGLYWVWLVTTLQVGDWHAIVHPTAHPGEEIVLSLWDVTSVEGPERYHLAKSGHEVEVVGPTAGLRVGHSVSVEVQIGPTGAMIEQWREAHPRRPAKKWAGFVSLGFLALFLPLAFWRRQRMGAARG